MTHEVGSVRHHCMQQRSHFIPSNSESFSVSHQASAWALQGAERAVSRVDQPCFLQLQDSLSYLLMAAGSWYCFAHTTHTACRRVSMCSVYGLGLRFLSCKFATEMLLFVWCLAKYQSVCLSQHELSNQGNINIIKVLGQAFNT